MNIEEIRQIRRQAEIKKKKAIKEANKVRLMRAAESIKHAEAYIPDIMTRVRAAAEESDTCCRYYESDVRRATPKRTRILRRAKLPDGVTIEDIMLSIVEILREDGYDVYCGTSLPSLKLYLVISWGG